MTQATTVIEGNEHPLALFATGTLTTAQLFEPNGLDAAIAKVREHALAHVPDISTDKGRRAIASMARKVASSKVYLDDLGKKLVSDIKAQSVVIDAERKRMRDELDGLRDAVRRPLTEFEDAEKQRIDGHESAIREIEAMTWRQYPIDPAQIQATMDACEGYRAREWQEFASRADRVIESTLKALRGAKEEAQKRIEAEAEADRLRQVEAERQRKEREERIANEAADRAKRQAEQIAEAQRLAAEGAKRQAEDRARKAEQQAEQAKRDAEAAVERERQRVAAEQQKQADEEARREANRRHCGRINREIANCLIGFALDEKTAKAIVAAMAKGEVPHVKVSY